MILVIIATFSYGIYKRRKMHEGQVYVELRAIQVDSGKGWGYDILKDGHPYIHQDAIPGLGGNRMFRTREDALTIGKIVYDRVVAGQPPIINDSDIIRSKIYIPPADTTGKTRLPMKEDTIRNVK